MSKRGAVKLLPVIQPKPNPCLHCPDPPKEMRLERVIAVGFGEAHLECDGRIIWSEMEAERKNPDDDLMTFADAEKLAERQPKHDWRIVLHGPLHGETYQRQGPGKWLCIEQNEGFA